MSHCWALFLWIFFCVQFVTGRRFRDDFDDSIQRDFTGYKVLRISPETDENLDFLRDLYSHADDYDLDFWLPPTKKEAFVDVAVSPSDLESFRDELKERQVHHNVLIDDLQMAINRERVMDPASPTGQHDHLSSFRSDRYNTLEQIENYMFLIRERHPQFVSIIEIGRTHENRSIYVMKIGKKGADELYDPSDDALVEPKSAIWIDAGIHAREWIAPAVALHFIDKLVQSEAMLNNFRTDIDWYILPVMNPDGYVYSHEKVCGHGCGTDLQNRMWRKNRRPSTCYKTPMSAICCSGVDLNRNFDWYWGTTGSSSDPCHDTYHGTEAFSETESRAVRDFLEVNPVTAFITLHSYSQLWLIPFGHRRRAYPTDYQSSLRPLAIRAVRAMSSLYGTKYNVGTGADLMYEASGASHDYAKGRLEIPFTYLVELRPQNTAFANGFLLPEHEIQPTGEETWQAIKVIAEAVLSGAGRRAAKPSTAPYSTTPPSTTVPTEEPTTPETTTEEEPTTELIEETTTEEVTTPTTEEPTTEETTTPKKLSKLLPGVEITVESVEELSNLIVPNRVVHCNDHGRYCKWWKLHNLCEKDRVRRLCALSCLPECGI